VSGVGYQVSETPSSEPSTHVFQEQV
jgi:hypothetical protein